MVTNLPDNTLLTYTDESLRAGGKAGAADAVYSANNLIHSQQQKLSNWSSSSLCELYSILIALKKISYSNLTL